MQQLSLEKNNSAISDRLHAEWRKGEKIGVTNGLSGISLYFFLLGLKTGDQNAISQGEEILNKCFDLLQENYNSITYLKDIGDVGILLHLLEQHHLVDIDSSREMLLDIAVSVKELYYNCIARKLFDPMIGFLGAASFYLMLYEKGDENPLPDVEKILTDTLICLQESAHTDNKGIYWISRIFNDERIYTGISHGNCANLLFILKVYKAGIKQELAKELLLGGIKYLFNKASDSMPYFPVIINEQERAPISNLCYGDIGTAYTIFEISRTLGLSKEALEASRIIIQWGDEYLKQPAAGLYDSSLLYGWGGIATVYKNMYIETGETCYRNVYDLIINKMMETAAATAGFSTYASVYNQRNPFTNLSFSEGVCGIGCMLMYTSSLEEKDPFTIFMGL